MSDTTNNGGEKNEQAQKANDWSRRHFGAEVDAAAGAAGLHVLPPGEAGGPPRVPWVELPGAEGRRLNDFANDLGAALAEQMLFRREGMPLPAVIDEATGDVNAMTALRFMTWHQAFVVVYEVKAVKVGNDFVKRNIPRDMPKTTAQVVLESDNFLSRLRPLLRVNQVRAPWIGEDGKLVLLPEGYHEASQIYTLRSPVKIDESWSLEKARLFLQDKYGEFVFREGDEARSLAVAITLPVALWGVGMLPTEEARPGFMARANTQGGGKSLIMQMGMSAAYGWPENTPKTKEDELMKTLASVVMGGSPYLFFDNLKGHFENALIEGFITSPVYKVRVMGTQKFMKGKVCCMLIVTGNNLTVSPDLDRRLLQVNLFQRDHEIRDQVHKQILTPVIMCRPAMRGDFLSALWALIRNWNEVGRGGLKRPPAGPLERPTRMPGFAPWCDMFGGIVQAAGYANPIELPKSTLAAAPAKAHQRLLVEALATGLETKHPRKDYEVQDLFDACYENEWFTWMMDGKVQASDGSGEDTFKPTPSCASKMGIMFTDEMGDREFQMEDGRRVRFSKQGAGRAKRYVVELVVSTPAGAPAA